MKRVPAAELEKLVLNEIGAMLAKPEMVASILEEARQLDANGGCLKAQDVNAAFANLSQMWEVMYPVEQQRLMREIIDNVTVFPDKVQIDYNAKGMESIISEVQSI